MATATIASSIVGLLQNLALPYVLPAAEYARYSIVFASAQVIASTAFEWLRIILLRYAYTADSEKSEIYRGMAARIYVLIAGGLFAGGIICIAFGTEWLQLTDVGVTLCFAALQGLYDGQQAIIRARVDNARYAVSVLTRAIAGAACAIAFAYSCPSGRCALVGFSVGYITACFLDVRAHAVHICYGKIHSSELGFFIRFGAPAAINTNLSLAIPALIRGVVMAGAGPSAAGGILLAIDLAQRIFATIGAATNVMFVQSTIRAIEFLDAQEVRRALKSQTLAATIVIIPLAILFVLERTIISDLLPKIYREGFFSSIAFVSLAMSLMTLRQYSLDPLFVVFGKSSGAPIGSLVTLLTLICVVHFSEKLSMQGLLVATAIAAAAGLITSAITIALTISAPWPIRDFAKIVFVSCVTILVGLILPDAHTRFDAVVNGVVMCAFFGAGLLVPNTLNCRWHVGKLGR